MTPFPRDGALDGTLALLSDPYRFVSTRGARLGTDVFETRLMLRRALCVTGEEAARMFYEPDRFTRRGAIPVTALLLLQDRGSAATLDGDAHRHRKRMLLSLMTPDRVAALGDTFAETWRGRLDRWAGRRVVLARELPEILCGAACAWSGVPVADDAALRRRAEDFRAMYEGAGAVGPRNWWGLLRRAGTERWARGLVERVRAGTLGPPVGSALRVIADHREPDGAPMRVAHAAVELINVLRPTVAVERFVTFAAHALHLHPESRERLGVDDEPEYLDWFVQEVRRFYPFFPLVGGRARQAFEWRGHHVPRGTWVLLDLYGTDHDARRWERPDEFRPERFRGRVVGPFDLVPQGGGDHHANHRCAGEWVTVELMKRAVRLLTREMRYTVPPQDLRLDMSRMPAVPRSRVVITDVQRVA
ncbi:MAG TPA: cytochrome P450 [Gemmatimonadaceae bacterium]|nr:cytochrome P450 [Gemmatimonadaceae bacterium]